METFLSEFELYTLLTVLRLGHEAYGVSIATELESLRSSRISLSAIYAALERLESRGLVTAELGEATPERGGRAKRYFHVTAQGIAQLRATRATLTRLWRHMPAQKGSA